MTTIIGVVGTTLFLTPSGSPGGGSPGGGSPGGGSPGGGSPGGGSPGGGSPAGLISPTFVADDEATLASNTLNPTFSLTCVTGGDNRAIIFVCHSEGVLSNCHNTCTYNSVALTRIGVVAEEDPEGTSQVPSTVSFWRMMDSAIPTAGAYTLSLNIDVSSQGHNAVLMQWDDVDQTNPVGLLQTNKALLGSATVTLGTTQTGNALDGLVTACGVSDGLGTYVTGDIVDNGSNMNIVSEGNSRNAPGGALRVAHDIIGPGSPNASEAYTWAVDYGAESVIDSIVVASINLNVTGTGGSPLLLCSGGCSKIPDLDENNDGPTNSWVGAKWHSNGDVSYYEATSQGFGATSGQRWVGNCAGSPSIDPTQYDARWTLISGEQPVDGQNPAQDQWVRMGPDGSPTGGVFVEYAATLSETDDTGIFQFQLRRRSDNVTLLTDQFEMIAETVDPGK